MILDEIIKKTKEDLKKRKADYPQEWLGRSLAYNPYVPRDVLDALRSSKDEPIKIIAEIKKASPSKGVIRETTHTCQETFWAHLDQVKMSL